MAGRPKQNRVTPLGDIVAIEQRGAWLGNRGILHRDDEVVRFHASPLWITCALRFKDWRLPQWEPHHFTVLFFLDEAVSLAAGHRPCALCRRDAYDAYRAAAGTPEIRAVMLDKTLHGERLHPGTHRRRLHSRPWKKLPDGAFVLVDDVPMVVVEDRLVAWTHGGYASSPVARPAAGEAAVITPPTSLTVLANGYPVQVGIPEPS